MRRITPPGRVMYSGWIAAIGVLGMLLVGVDAHRTASLAGVQPAPATSGSGAQPAPEARDDADDAFHEFDEFDHQVHEGLFPLCIGCHIGAETGDDTRLFPDAASCMTCHDGETQPQVEWQPPPTRGSNLVFAHDVHARALVQAGQPDASCAECHADTGPSTSVPTDSNPVRMRGFGEPVIQAENCLSCHDEGGAGVRGAGHLEVGECALCHVPAASSALDSARIAGLPTPADHEADAFLSKIHGTQGADDPSQRCATCHVQDQCAACHVNAARVPSIRALPRGLASAGFRAIEARYPVPESHGVARFSWDHGAEAAPDAAACATCHTQTSCRSCHIDPVPDAVAQLPVAGDTLELPPLRVAPGTVVHAGPPESHGDPFFDERHGTLASTQASNCATCHAEEVFCTGCHEGLESGGQLYHEPAYVVGHAADAAQPVLECATCHDPVAFCRTCHDEQGLQSRGRLGPGYHDAEPLWLLRHPQAARQQLETCVSCHTQRDCLQCHSQLGSFQISPHGPDFDAQAAWQRNPVVCRACHIGDPFGQIRSP